MQTHLADWLKDRPDGKLAESILRKCVHCGFCTATCPTYQLLGDELDGPRGRIYLIKQVVEGKPATRATQQHLDRCLTCRNCETTCPSGVDYGHLVDVGRALVDEQVNRPWRQRVVRTLLREGLTRRWLFEPAMKLGQSMRPFVPAALRDKVPEARRAGAWPRTTHARRVIMPAGCVQPAMAPSIDAATARVFDKLGIETLRAADAGCCGAMRLHLDDPGGARAQAKRNIDAWIALLDAGAEAIVVNASGCGAMVKDYGHLLADESQYAERAERVSRACRDPIELLGPLADQIAQRVKPDPNQRVAFHPPCSLQHGQRLAGVTESLLQAVGARLTQIEDAHLCCGSAGAYSVLQPELATRLRARKLRSILADAPDQILSANIGCLTHLQAGARTPVRHWLEWLDQQMVVDPPRAPAPGQTVPLAAAAGERAS